MILCVKGKRRRNRNYYNITRIIQTIFISISLETSLKSVKKYIRGTPLKVNLANERHFPISARKDAFSTTPLIHRVLSLELGPAVDKSFAKQFSTVPQRSTPWGGGSGFMADFTETRATDKEWREVGRGHKYRNVRAYDTGVDTGVFLSNN